MRPADPSDAATPADGNSQPAGPDAPSNAGDPPNPETVDDADEWVEV